MVANKKDDHLLLTKKFYDKSKLSDFDNIRFVYHSFPETSIKEADISTSFANLKMDQPFFINAMTGGSDKTRLINEKLALLAKETNLAIASGSLSAAIKDDSLVSSFQILRKVNPKGLIFANLGAEHGPETAKRAIDILEADAIQIHCNVLQELIMPEGDRDFNNWLKNIEAIVKEVKVPVIVKEVGFGMSRQSVKQLRDIGVKTIDVSGSGGTNFAQIENFRRKTNKYDYLEDFGQSTVVSLLEAQSYMNDLDIIASGGIRNPLDIVKSLSLGAKAVGIAGLILELVLNKGVEEAILEINNWKTEVSLIMTLLGKRTISDLVYTDLLVLGNLKEWCHLRGIKYETFANRLIV